MKHVAMGLVVIEMVVFAFAPCGRSAEPEAELPAPLAMERIKADSTAQRTELIKRLKKRLADLRTEAALIKAAGVSKSIDGDSIIAHRPERMIFKTPEIKAAKAAQWSEWIKAAQQAYREMETGKRQPIPELKLPLEAGQAGRMYAKGVRIVQVVGGDTAIVHVPFDSRDPSSNAEWRDLWMSGVPTASAADGGVLPLDADNDVFEVVGNKTYGTTDGGTNTVPRIVRLNAEQCRALAKKMANQPY